MKNRYIQFSKKPQTTPDDDLLTWRITYEVDMQRFVATFSDGTKKAFKTKQEARRYINEKFFSLYF